MKDLIIIGIAARLTGSGLSRL